MLARATASLAAGSRTVQLDADPVGWAPGDEIVITPTGRPTEDDSSALAYDTARGDGQPTVTLARVGLQPSCASR